MKRHQMEGERQNMARTGDTIDAGLTQTGSRPVRAPIRVAIIDPDGKRHGPFGDSATMERYIEQHFSPLPIVFDGEGYDLEFVTQ